MNIVSVLKNVVTNAMYGGKLPDSTTLESVVVVVEGIIKEYEKKCARCRCEYRQHCLTFDGTFSCIGEQTIQYSYSGKYTEVCKCYGFME